MLDVNRQLVRLSAVARKWQDRVISCLHNDHVSIITLRVRIERGRLHRMNSQLEEDEPFDSETDPSPPERRIGPPRNLCKQSERLSEKVEKYVNRLHATMEGEGTVTCTIRAKVEGGRVFRVNTLVDVDEPLEEREENGEGERR